MSSAAGSLQSMVNFWVAFLADFLGPVEAFLAFLGAAAAAGAAAGVAATTGLATAADMAGRGEGDTHRIAGTLALERKARHKKNQRVETHGQRGSPTDVY